MRPNNVIPWIFAAVYVVALVAQPFFIGLFTVGAVLWISVALTIMHNEWPWEWAPRIYRDWKSH